MDFSFKLDDSKFKKELTDIEQKQLPFAAALALTRTAQAVGAMFMIKVNAKMNIRTAWAGKLANAKKDNSLSPGAAFYTIMAKKQDGLNKMEASLGTHGWQMIEQVEDTKTLRVPKKSPVRYKPLQAKNAKRANPSKTLNKKGVFINKTRNGVMMLQRTGKKRYPIKPLYRVVKQQEIKPPISLNKHAEMWAPKVFPSHFKLAFEHALKTAKR